MYFLSTSVNESWGLPGKECQWQRICLSMQETQEMQVRSLVGKVPWSWKWQPTPVFLPGKIHGQRSLVAVVHGVTESRTRLSTHTHTWMYLLVNFQIQKWDQRGDNHHNSAKGLFAHSCPSFLVQLDLLSLWRFYFRDAKSEWLANISTLLESISGIEYLRSEQY